jgi:hypothetical protein
MRGAIERYPNVTDEEQRALWQWYGNTHTGDIVDGAREVSARFAEQNLRRELPNQLWMRLGAPGAAIALVAIAVEVLK